MLIIGRESGIYHIGPAVVQQIQVRTFCLSQKDQIVDYFCMVLSICLFPE